MLCLSHIRVPLGWAEMEGPRTNVAAFAQHLRSGILVPRRPWNPVSPRTEAKAERT